MPRSDAAATARRLEVPLSEDRFFTEWESKTASYSALEPGVFICGLAHGPKPVREVRMQALAAAQSALRYAASEKVIEKSAKAEIDQKKCTSCLTCVRVCPYSVPRIGSRGFPSQRTQGKAFIDVLRCQGCGTCISECPARAISLEQYSDARLIDSGIMGEWPETGLRARAPGKNAGAPNDGAGTFRPDITVLNCRYCGNVPVELSGVGRISYPAGVKVIEVPCTGGISSKHILRALEQGADGVLVLGCPEGTCHHITGNIRAKSRVEAVRSLLEKSGADPVRIRFANLGIGDGAAFARLVTDMTAELAGRRSRETVTS